MHTGRFLITTLIFLSGWLVGMSQPGAEIEVKKPKKYENRKLASEKTGEKKFTIPRKLYQNTVTHYNYYFNANNRLNDLVNTAKASFKDDYSQLLPFYNYTLDQTSQSKQDIDSIIYKCTAGILLHDLRNSWIDNMYLVLAKAYFFRNDLDSAGLTLQYLNFSFAPKEDGGYDKPIGSNASNEVGEFSIATKEKNSIWKKLTSRPPSRNESFIWQIRNHIEKNELPEASGVIEILRHDPNFPTRLQTDLHEAMAYWFYKQQAYDSAAYYLSGALSEAANNQEKARWEYLIAQMYQLADKNEEAVKFYDRSISHTTDPVMDVYARLNSIRINRADKKDYLQQNIDALLKMARRDKYLNYRDIIYYAAANIELERDNYLNAQDDLLKSVKYTTNNPAQRSQSFLLLADLNYKRKSYSDAYNYYDSTDVNMLPTPEDKDRVTLRKPPLKTIAENLNTITTQDSLQALAKLPVEQRDAIIKKQAKALRKAQGLKEEDTPGSNPAVKQMPDLFSENNKSTDFYFYNSSAKARGFSEFRARWGERPNVDNWRRKSALDRQVQRISDVDDVPSKAVTADQKVIDNSYEGLVQNIPTTQEKLDASNKSIMDALFSSGQTFMNKLEEYPDAVVAFEELLRRFPNAQNKEEALFNLSYAYEKTGDKVKADQYKKQLISTSPDGKFAKLVSNPPSNKNSAQANPATKKYEEIYKLFIEGNFDEAKNQKKNADSTYGKSFWTPQLLFIESIYYIRQKEDSSAIKVLTDLSTLYNGDPMAARAKTMIDVLRRRKEIEDYLTKLEVTRNEDVNTVGNNNASTATRTVAGTVVPPTPVVGDSANVKNSTLPVPSPSTIKKDTVATPPVVIKNFTFVASDPHYVVVLLDKVDPVYASEARNAFNRFNQEKYYNQKIDISGLKLNEQFNLVLEGPFVDANAALEYIDKVRPIAKSRILPWLTAEKFSFMVISNANLDVLKANQDMDAYKVLIQKAIPGKF
jgi:outer membrane protein assembly factor BamD (BamD/ComL family)